MLFTHKTASQSLNLDEASPTQETSIDLEIAESKDPKKLEIVKQIRRVNPDGSYTIGFEAEDGTFKIESRDVLGNIKGTYGYIDENGEIKRVTYGAHNNSTRRTTTTSQSQSQQSESEQEEEVVHIPPRFNRTYPVPSTTRRPANLAFLTSTASPTKSSVIQAIPKKRILLSSSSSTKKVETETPTTIVYPMGTNPTAKPLFIVRPTQQPHTPKTNEQIARPEKLETKDGSKSSLPAKEHDKKPTRGNLLRRQLTEENSAEQFEAQQQVVYGQNAGEEVANIYTSNGRTYATTTRIPATVLAAKQRIQQLQNVLTTIPTTTTERPVGRKHEGVSYESTTAEPSSENSYITQNPNLNGGDASEPIEDERRLYRPRPIDQQLLRPREYNRYYQPTSERALRIPIPIASQRTPEQYLRETTPIPIRGSSTIAPENYDEEINNISYRQQQRRQQPQQPQQSIPVPYPYGPYERNPYGNPYYSDYQDRPLTARDFERLLQLLLFRHQSYAQPYRFGGGLSNPYYPGPSNVPPYIPQYGGYPPQIPRPPFYQSPSGQFYDPRYQNPLYSPTTSSRQYASQEADYQNLEENPPRRLPPSRRFRPQYDDPSSYGQAAGQTQDYLPPDVRENLLYRMLMLAITGEQSQGIPAPSNTHIQSTTPTTNYSKKPVRSVQILGEE